MKLKFLIVEDCKEMRRLIKMLLVGLAEQIRECDDGAEALTAYESYEPDWVLMDIKLDQVDGITATRQIKAAYPDAKIVMVTGYDDTALRQEAQVAGVDGYVLKENLLEVIALLAPSIP